MFGKGKDLFRTKALDRISSPENLDQLMELVAPKDWIALIVIAMLLVGVIAWSITGRLPTAVVGHGVLIRPRKVVEVQSLGTGRLETLTVHVGDAIKEGEIIGEIDQLETRRRLQDDRALLADLQSQDRAKSGLQDQQMTLQRQQDEGERRILQIQRDNLVKNLQDAQALTPELKRRLDSLQRLRSRDLIPELSSELLAAQQAHVNNLSVIADFKARIEQLDTQYMQFEARETSRTRETLEGTTARRNQIRDLTARISLAELELKRNSSVRVEHSGKVLEVLVHAGQLIVSGTHVLSMEADDAATGLVAVTYFPVKDGKKVQTGMPIQVVPDTVERQRFGGIVGKVVSVSSHPVTREGALGIIGNPEIVTAMLAGGPAIEVTAELEQDETTFSGYKWSSSKGPQSKMSAGLTGAGRVTVDGRAPITFVFPFLRSLSGIY
jgi:HlyD family secretion protein